MSNLSRAQRELRNQVRRLGPDAHPVQSADLNKVRRYAIKCTTCGLDHEVVGLSAASRMIGDHISGGPCPRMGVFAEPVAEPEQNRQRIRNRIEEVTRG